MSDPIVIYGTGGHGRELLAVVEALNAERPSWHVEGWVDDDPGMPGRQIAGLPVLGDGDWLASHRGVAVALGIGDPRARKRVAERVSRLGGLLPILIDPLARVMARSAIGAGTVLMAGAVVSVDSILGHCCVINLNGTVSHDCRIGDYGTLGPGAVLAGNVRLGDGVEVGANATCIPGSSIGSWSRIGAGAVVISDLAAEVTAVGVPARPLANRTLQ